MRYLAPLVGEQVHSCILIGPVRSPLRSRTCIIVVDGLECAVEGV